MTDKTTKPCVLFRVMKRAIVPSVLIVGSLAGAGVAVAVTTGPDHHDARCYRVRMVSASGAYSQWGPIVRTGPSDGFPRCRSITVHSSQ